MLNTKEQFYIALGKLHLLLHMLSFLVLCNHSDLCNIAAQQMPKEKRGGTGAVHLRDTGVIFPDSFSHVSKIHG